MFLITNRVSILENTTTTDSYNDEVSSYKLVKRNVAGNIFEKQKNVWDATTGRHTTVTIYGAFIPTGTKIAKDYRLKDEKNDRIYNVEAVHDHISIVGSWPIELELKRLDTPRT